MPSRGDTLLKLVYEHPEDLGARRAYADWLVEQGDVRGELIGLQCARAERGGSIAVERREVELLLEHGREWLGPFAKQICDFRFERGFLARAELKGVTKAMVGHESWATIEQVELTAVDGDVVAAFLSSPVLRSLELIVGLGPLAFARLLDSAPACRARELHVVGVEPRHQRLPLHVVQQHFPRLQKLAFD